MGRHLLSLVKWSHLAKAQAPARKYCSTATQEKLSKAMGADDEIYHPIEEEYTEKPEYPADIPSVYDRSDKRIAHARKLISNIVRDLPTVQEKIDFVNPYEREWTDVEIRRHRDYHRPLIRPRKAWSIPPVPNRYDSLPLYKYVTNTHTIKGLPNVYDSIEISESELQHFKSQLLNLLKIELLGRQDIKESVDAFVEQMSELMYRTYCDDFPHVKNSQIGLNVRYESFAERAGFRHLYADYSTKSLKRLRTDHVHKLGQFVFCFRDTANVQYRSELSLPPFVSTADPICRTEVERFLHSPSYYTHLVSDPLFMVPGGLCLPLVIHLLSIL
uniref:Uncharacterized protein n=1 Tax=Romanomermis culicivorax TaxID=13658 RepID=A0A915HQI3_ROMCU